MEILSSAKTIKCLSFPDLNVKAVHRSNLAEAESIHFEFFNRTRYFFTLSKSYGLELFRVGKPKRESSIFDSRESSHLTSCKRYRLDNVACIACPKRNSSEVAIGLNNGFVKLYDFRKSLDFTTKLHPDRVNNSCIHIDFNAQDEYLSTVYENGIVSVFGLNTGIKVKNLETDKYPNMARFHPTKRFYLAIGTNNGSVSIKDVQSTKNMFRCKEAHGAPLRDIAMCSGQPHLMLTVGYDCVVNLFDTRDKKSTVKLKTAHPLNCCAMSSCGNFFCVGTLKGEVISYDVRNLDQHYGSSVVHDNSVSRLEFIPEPDSQNLRASLNMAAQQSTIEVSRSGIELSRNSTTARLSRRDSFDDVFNMFGPRSGDRGNLSRDNSSDMNGSFIDWEKFNRRVNDFPQLRLSSAPRRGRSSCVPDQAVIIEEDQEDGELTDFLNANQSRLNNFNPQHIDNDTMRNITLRRRNEPRNDEVSPAQLEDNSKKVSNSYYETAKVSLRDTPDAILVPATDDDKENLITNRQMRNAVQSSVSQKATGVKENDTLTTTEFNILLEKLNQMQSNFNDEFRRLRYEMTRSNWDVTSKIYTSTFNLLKEPTDNIEQLCSSVNLLMNENPIIAEVYRLRQESAELKLKLHELQNPK